MRGKSIFSWPNPYFWLALEGIILVGNIEAGNFGTFIVWSCVLVIFASLIYYFREGRHGKKVDKKVGDQEARLQEIERRLTDTQDIMIALSEKLDQWEAEGRTASSNATGRSST